MKLVQHMKSNIKRDFWNCKFIGNSHLKVEKYKPEKCKHLKVYIKMKKTIIKFSDIDIEKQKC